MLDEGLAALQALDAEIAIQIALDDGKERLLRGAERLVRLVAALQPLGGAFHRLLRLLVRVAVLRTLIERHDDVRPQIVLDVHRLFGREEVIASVDVRGKAHAVVRDVVERGERKDLEAAAVREDGAVPVHEFVQPPCAGDELIAGAHIQVIGVGEDDLRADLLEIARQHALDGRLRTDGHIDGRQDIAVRGVKDARPRARLGIDLL